MIWFVVIAVILVGAVQAYRLETGQGGTHIPHALAKYGGLLCIVWLGWMAVEAVNERPQRSVFKEPECRVDWDGYSNPVECD